MIEVTGQRPRIAIDPTVMLGKPCIKGSRMPVSLILEELGDGMTPTEIVEAHPFLTLDDVRAAQAFADVLARETVLLADA